MTSSYSTSWAPQQHWFPQCQWTPSPPPPYNPEWMKDHPELSSISDAKVQNTTIQSFSNQQHPRSINNNSALSERTYSIYNQQKAVFKNQFKDFLRRDAQLSNEELSTENAQDEQVVKELESQNTNAKTQETQNKAIIFKDIPINVNFDEWRKYFSFEQHGISFGKDFTGMALGKQFFRLSSMHAQMRLKLFRLLCEFVVENAKNFKDYKIPCGLPIPNEFKAFASYTPFQRPVPKVNRDEVYKIKPVEAHISFFPNLPLTKVEKSVYVHGGVIDLDGTPVSVEEMLNLTNRVPRVINHIDAVVEPFVRPLGMELLARVAKGEITPNEATVTFGNKYSAGLRALSIYLNKIPMDQLTTKQKKPLMRLKEELEYCLGTAYCESHYEEAIGKHPDAVNCINGMKAGIEAVNKAILNNIHSKSE